LARMAFRAFAGEETESAQEYPGYGLTVREVPLPGALRVPSWIRLLIDVRGPLEQVLARSSHGIWRRARPLAERAHVLPVTDDGEIDRISEEMLVPYAAEKHHEEANQVPIEKVRDLARRGGLVSIHLDGEEVAARLGFSYERHGARYFHAWRFGYPRRVFNDPERYGAVNGLNSYLAIQHAHESGHHVFDFGLSPAHPVENGQLQFKRMRGGAVSTVNCHSFFSVRMARECAARFLWTRPLFSVEGRRIILNVGVPSDLPDEEMVQRVHQKLVFQGVSLLRLHAERPVSEALKRSISATWRVENMSGSKDGPVPIDMAAV